jgi:hypothetical protein
MFIREDKPSWARWRRQDRGRGMGQKTDKAARETRLGSLKNGNPSGDFTKAPRCGAKNRRGLPCQQPAMKNGRCRLHGGKSTGARTAEGRRRIAQANLKHGYYAKAARQERRDFRAFMKRLRQQVRELEIGPGPEER